MSKRNFSPRLEALEDRLAPAHPLSLLHPAAGGVGVGHRVSAPHSLPENASPVASALAAGVGLREQGHGRIGQVVSALASGRGVPLPGQGGPGAGAPSLPPAPGPGSGVLPGGDSGIGGLPGTNGPAITPAPVLPAAPAPQRPSAPAQDAAPSLVSASLLQAEQPGALAFTANPLASDPASQPPGATTPQQFALLAAAPAATAPLAGQQSALDRNDLTAALQAPSGGRRAQFETAYAEGGSDSELQEEVLEEVPELLPPPVREPADEVELPGEDEVAPAPVPAGAGPAMDLLPGGAAEGEAVEDEASTAEVVHAGLPDEGGLASWLVFAVAVGTLAAAPLVAPAPRRRWKEEFPLLAGERSIP